MMLMCAPVAVSGEVRVMVASLPPSQALRISGESVLPCRSQQDNAEANSGSKTISRLSEIPGSTTSSAFSFAVPLFHFVADFIYQSFSG